MLDIVAGGFDVASRGHPFTAPPSDCYLFPPFWVVAAILNAKGVE